MSELGQKLIAIVRKKAAENPDFVYELPPGEGASCVYMDGDCPSCLIGHALYGAGLINTEIALTYDNKSTISWFAFARKLPLDEAEIYWLQDVQQRQDDQTSWGDAVYRADQTSPLP